MVMRISSLGTSTIWTKSTRHKLPNVLPWNQFQANSLSQLKLTKTTTRSSFQLVSTSFSFEPEIDLKALVRCFLPLVQDLVL
jgi:hypothetical protein